MNPSNGASSGTTPTATSTAATATSSTTVTGLVENSVGTSGRPTSIMGVIHPVYAHPVYAQMPTTLKPDGRFFLVFSLIKSKNTLNRQQAENDEL